MTEWWQAGVIYQIYPRSYCDINGDGIGDLPGILSRLDYLSWLGVDAIWISPIFPSPMADFGYDISDYRDIHPLFGSLTDFDRLLAEAHAKGIKIILDYVPNHSSNLHPWFLESRSSKKNPKRDWYIWRDPAPDGGLPNNWLSRFDGKSAWAWDAKTEQYYLHSFLPEQPDLNWRNSEVKEGMLDVLRFWFNRGVDGLRVDVAYRPLKDPLFRDNPVNPDWEPGMDPSEKVIEKYTKNFPEIHNFNRWIRAVSDEYENRVLVGEMNLPFEALVKHYGDGDEFHLPYNFSLIWAPWQADRIRELVEAYERSLPAGAWPNWVLGNHDQPRFVSRFGEAAARSGLMLLLTLRGTPTIYYGDEIGMTDVEIPVDKIQDPWEKNVPGFGRDPERTPMQWDGSPNAGFCPPDVEPWLPVANDADTRNVEVQKQQPTSMLNFSRQLLHLRRESPALHRGDYRTIATLDGVYVYERIWEAERWIAAINFTPEAKNITLGEPMKVVLSTYMDRTGESLSSQTQIRGNEGLLLIPKTRETTA